MILAAAFALCILTVPLFRGRLSRLAAIGVRRRWTILAALVIQFVIISVIPAGLPAPVAAAFHLSSYALTLVFLQANWRIPGMAILLAGGLANLVAIGANGGVMPASQRALERSGRVTVAGEFINSEAQADAHFQILGDIFALPEGVPLANVFSIGDILLVAGGAVIAHKACGSSLPFRRRRLDEAAADSDVELDSGAETETELDTGSGADVTPRAWAAVGRSGWDDQDPTGPEDVLANDRV